MKKGVFVVIFALLFSLGLWQVLRLNWKNDIIKSIGLPAIHLLISDDLEKFNYRHVTIDGVLSNVELYVFAGQYGYYILSPMLLTTGNYMLINKGIINEKREREVKIKKVVVEGILYCDNKKNWFIKNDISSNMWFTFNTEEISNELGIKLEKCILWQGSLSNKLVIQPMKHLEYAVTWFLLALIWLIMCIAYYKKNCMACSKLNDKSQ